jgi:hypothetical protein
VCVHTCFQEWVSVEGRVCVFTCVQGRVRGCVFANVLKEGCVCVLVCVCVWLESEKVGEIFVRVHEKHKTTEQNERAK